MGGTLGDNLAPPVLAIELVEWMISGDWPGILLSESLALPFSVCLIVVGLILCVEGLDRGERGLRENARWFSIT